VPTDTAIRQGSDSRDQGWAKNLAFEDVWNQMQSVWVDLRHRLTV
jgi:hypothetical protein